MPENLVAENNQPQSSRKINWKFILIGIFVGTLLIGGGVAVWLLLGQPSTTPPSSIPTATSSSNTPTPSSQVDETTGWNTYSNEELAFFIKYPTDWQISEDEGTSLTSGENVNISVSAKDEEETSSFRVTRNPVGGLSLSKTREERVIIDGIEATKVYLQDRQDLPSAKEGEHTWTIYPVIEINGIRYEITAGWTIGDTDSLETLNKILETLAFIE